MCIRDSNNAVSDTVKELLPIADNIERALGQENASAEDMNCLLYTSTV